MDNQLSLFAEVVNAYSLAQTPIKNDTLYKILADKLDLPEDVTKAKGGGKNSEASYNLFKRKVRWFQQSLKHAGILERIEGERGAWCIKKEKADELDKIIPTLSVLGFSTSLGVAVIGYSQNVFNNLNEELHLICTSPPYPLKTPRKYGNVKESEYVDWLCTTMEPAIKKLAPGGSLALNIGQDIFKTGSPERSMYIERLLIALHDRFSLKIMDRCIWNNPSKPPGPIAWASKQRVHLNTGYEFVFWLTNDPAKVYSNNQRVLLPHSEKHLEFIKNGGAKHAASKSDGAYKLKVGSYSNMTAGRIPRNVISMGHTCAENRAYLKEAKADGYATHGAMMPFNLAKFFIEFLTMPGQLVADTFAGKITTGRAAETLGRRWICTDPVVDYVMGGANRFVACDGFQRNHF